MAAPRTKPAEKMKKHELTREHLQSIVRYDPETGIFTRVKKTCNRVKVGEPCGSLNTKGYLQISIENRLYLASNLAWLYMTGQWPAGVVDHKNTIRTDNRWTNLRDATNEVNAQNRRAAMKTSKSGLLGVSPAHGKWAATIVIEGQKRHLGLFTDPAEASAVYIDAKRKHHPGNTL